MCCLDSGGSGPSDVQGRDSRVAAQLQAGLHILHQLDRVPVGILDPPLARSVHTSLDADDLNPAPRQAFLFSNEILTPRSAQSCISGGEQET